MKKAVRFSDIEIEIVISNEKEGDGGYWGYERGAGIDELTLEIGIKDFYNLSNAEIDGLKAWLIGNAETQIRAAIHKRDELEEARSVQRRTRMEKEREEKKKAKREGFVYLIAADNGMHKIGKTVNLTNRVNEFGIKLPMKTWLVHSFKSQNYDVAELQLHELFEDKRSHGEWFVLTDEDVQYICSIQDGQL